MNIANHALTGVLIAGSVANPVAAVTGSLVSHYVLDAMPHFGFNKSGYKEALKHESTKYVVGIASIITLSLGVIILLLEEYLLFACGLAAIAPDLVATYGYFAYEKRGKQLPYLARLHKQKLHAPIQTMEFPKGIYVEIFMLLVLGYGSFLAIT